MGIRQTYLFSCPPVWIIPIIKEVKNEYKPKEVGDVASPAGLDLAPEEKEKFSAVQCDSDYINRLKAESCRSQADNARSAAKKCFSQIAAKKGKLLAEVLKEAPDKAGAF